MAPQNPEPVETDASAPPLPNGVDWATGALLPAISAEDLKHIDEDSDDVRRRERADTSFAMADEAGDPNKLEDAGWGVSLGPTIGDDVRKALGPLLQHREAQAGPLYKEFTGAKAYRAGESVREWLKRQNVGFATVNPALGVPLYLLIVASPQDIPFEFQYLLDAYWNVGRLYFDDGDVSKYARYAQQIVATRRLRRCRTGSAPQDRHRKPWRSCDRLLP